MILQDSNFWTRLNGTQVYINLAYMPLIELDEKANEYALLYLQGQLPIGILLDYLEDNAPEDIPDWHLIIQRLRNCYANPFDTHKGVC